MMEVSHSIQPASLYFNMIYQEEFEKQHAFLTKEQYLKFLKVLVEVHDECGVPHPNGISWRRNRYEIHKFTVMKPPSTIYDLIIRIQGFSVNFLFAAEAASRMEELKKCVSLFVKEWRKMNFFPVPTTKVDVFLRDDPLFNTVDRVIKNIQCKNCKIQELWLPNLSESTFLEMRSHLTGLETLIFREASGRRYSEEEIFGYLKKSVRTQDMGLAVLLHRYARGWTHFSFKDNHMVDVADSCVFLCVLLMDHLQFLDLSDCPLLTLKCLRSGHPTLETLVLTKTRINPQEIDRRKFPALRTVLKDDECPSATEKKKEVVYEKTHSCLECVVC